MSDYFYLYGNPQCPKCLVAVEQIFPPDTEELKRGLVRLRHPDYGPGTCVNRGKHFKLKIPLAPVTEYDPGAP